MKLTANTNASEQAQNTTSNEGKQPAYESTNGKQIEKNAVAPKKEGQFKFAKRTAALKCAGADDTAATFGSDLQNLPAGPSPSVASLDREPSTSAAAAAAVTINLARPYQPQIEDGPEDGDFKHVTAESRISPDDHGHGLCTCECTPRKLYLSGDEIETYNPKLMIDFAAKHSQLRTLIVAAELKLRADHLHNIWFGCVAAIRKCDCGPCSAPYSPCYEWIVRPAKEEYWAADKKLEEFLEQKKTHLTKEVISIMRPEGKAEKARANCYLRNRNLPNGMIKSLLPDGRDREVEVRGRGNYTLIPVIFGLNI